VTVSAATRPPRYRERNIPEELKRLDRWIVFALEGGNPGKPRKIPYIPETTVRAKSNDASTWRSFETAITWADRHGLYLGFAFDPSLDFTFIDLDDVIGAGSIPKHYAQRVIDALDSYTEVSVNGGAHVFVHGRPPERFSTEGIDGKIEIFPQAGGRFCLITGDTRPGLGSLHGYIEERTHELAALLPPRPATAPSSPIVGEGDALSDIEIGVIVAALAPSWILGQKHDMAVATGGIFAKNGIPEAQAVDVVRRLAINDDDPEDREKAVRDSYRKHRDGVDLRGYHALREMIAADALSIIDGIMQRVWRDSGPNVLDLEDEVPRAPSPPKRFVWSITELLAEDFPVILPMVGSILDRGSAMSLFGAGGAGKSWLSLSLGLSIATGTPWLDHFPTTPGRVLIIDQEGRPDRVQDRLLRLCEPDAVPADTPLTYARPSGWRVDTPVGYGRIRALIAEHAPDLVIIDSGTRFHQADENKSQEMANVAQHFAELTTDQGIALLIVDHANKVTTSDDPRARLRGSTDKINALDGALFIERRVGEQTLNVTPVKTRYDQELPPFAIVFDHSDGRTRMRYQSSAESTATPDDALAAIIRLSDDDAYGATIDTIGFALFSSPSVTSSQRSYRTRSVVSVLERQGRITRVDAPREAGRRGRKTAYQIQERRS
jgi:AAA domain